MDSMAAVSSAASAARAGASQHAAQAARAILGMTCILPPAEHGQASARGAAVAEFTEGGHAVRLGPDPDGAGAGDVLVARVDQAAAVERHADAVAGEVDPQHVRL